MGLSNELISEFAKITNDKKTSRIDEVTLYGEVVKCDDSVCVKFDGSDELTPVTTITEKDEHGNITNYKYGAASVKTGDRVSVLLKNHSATITGNLTDPPMGRAEVVIGEDNIVAKIDDQVKVEINKLGVRIDGIATFTNEVKGSVDGLSEGLSKGTTTIDGGCIKTGTIDAERISLKGLLEYQYSATQDGDDSTWHYPMATGDMYRRESIDGGKTWGDPYQFVGKDGKNGQNGRDGSDADVPSYIEVRGIDFTSMTNSYIKSPKIYGGEFYGNEFNVVGDSSSGSFNIYGDWQSKQYHMFAIEYYATDAPKVTLTSPSGAYINIGDNGRGDIFDLWGGFTFQEGEISFGSGFVIDFANATVKNLSTTTTPVYA